MKLVKKVNKVYWKTYEYTTPGTYTLTVPKNTACKLILVGGGGGGSASTSGFPGTWTAAGGSAGMVTGSSTIDAGSYTIVVGEHGIGRTRSGGNQTGTDGGDSTAFGNIAGGGGGGKTYLSGYDGSATPGAAGTTTTAAGFTGSNGVAGSTTSRYGTYGGGGAKGKNNGQDGYCKIELASDSSDYDYTKDEIVCYAVKEESEVEKGWVQPIVTAYGAGGENVYNVSAGSYYNNNETYNPIHAFDSDSSTFWASNSTSDYLLFYSPVEIKPTEISITNRPSSQNTWATGTVLGSMDGLTYYTLTEFTNTNNTANSTWNINIENPQYCKFIKIDGSGMSGISSTLGVVQCSITATLLSKETIYKGVK